MTGTTAREIPEVRDLVDVVLDCSTEPLVTSVASATGDGVVLDAPVDRSGRLVLPRCGSGGLMVWRGASAMQQVPVAVVDVSRPPDPHWRLRLTGSPSSCQRRAFVRADVELPVRLVGPGGAREAVALDLGEGGLRCTTASAEGLEVGALLQAELELDDVPARLRVEVVRLRRPADRPLDLGLRFRDLPMKDADRIRAHVFGQLRRLRAAGVG